MLYSFFLFLILEIFTIQKYEKRMKLTLRLVNFSLSIRSCGFVDSIQYESQKVQYNGLESSSRNLFTIVFDVERV